VVLKKVMQRAREGKGGKAAHKLAQDCTIKTIKWEDWRRRNPRKIVFSVKWQRIPEASTEGENPAM